MKTTKLLIGAMAVMSFAACQNEEMVAEQSPVAQGRKQIDVKIVPTQGTDSRMLNNNGVFSWETTDKLGAAMVDVTTLFTPENGKHFGNAQFNYADGAFTTASTLSVGTYVFYYPYNADNTTARNGVIVKNLGVQKFDATGEEMMNNNFMVAPVAKIDGSEAGELVLPMTFRSIYGYGKLTLTNNLNNDKDVEIQKIVIGYDAKLDDEVESLDGFVIGGKLAPASLSNFATDGLYAEGEHYSIKNMTVNLTPDNADASALFEKADSLYLNYETEDATVKPNPIQWLSSTVNGVVSISCLDGSEGISVANGASVTTDVLIPAGIYNKAGLKIIVYTNEGTVEISPEAITTADEEEDLVIVRNGRQKTVSAEFVGDLTPLGEVLEVINEGDFIASVKQFAENGADKLTIKMVGDKTVNNAMLAAIPANVDEVNFIGDVTIDATTTLRKVSFSSVNNDAVVTLAGNVTIQPGADIKNFADQYVDFVVKGTTKIAKGDFNAYRIQVVKGATLNVNAGVDLSGVSYFTSKGTVNLGSTGGNKIVLPSDYAQKSGELKVNSVVTGERVQLGITSETEPALNVEVNADIESDELSLEGNVILTNNVKYSKVKEENLTINGNAGDVINNTYVEVVMNHGSGVVENVAGAELLVSTLNNGKIENYGKAIVEKNQGTLKTEGDDIYATINQYEGAELLVEYNTDAAAIINTAADSETTVNTNTGYVNYVDGARIAVNGGAGNVAFEMEAPTDEDITKMAKAKPYINTLVITAADYTLAKALTIPESLTNIVFEGNATFSEAISTKQVTELTKGDYGYTDYAKATGVPVNLTFKGDVKFVKGATFVEGVTMTLEGGNTLDGSLVTVGKKPVKNAESEASKYNGYQGIQAPLTININNGYMTNKCEFAAHLSTFDVNFGEMNESKGIAAGSIWNDMIFSSTDTEPTVKVGNETETWAAVKDVLWKGTKITKLSYE